MADEVELGDLSDLADGALRAFTDVGEYGIVVCRVGGQLYAVDDNCSHAETPLSEGRLRGHSLICPLHGASFDVRDGSHSGPPAWEGIACHAIRESDGVTVVTVVTVRASGDAADGDDDAGSTDHHQQNTRAPSQ